MGLSAIFRIIALILFAIGSAPYPLPGNAVSMGLFFWLLANLIDHGGY